MKPKASPLISRKLTAFFIFVLLSAVVVPCSMGGTALWNASVDTNWDTPGNWTGGTGTAGVPGPGDDVVFGNAGNATVATAISNAIVFLTNNFAGTISSLSYTNSVGASFQNTLIGPGLTLTITNHTGPFGTALFVGTPAGAVANNVNINASISGAGATLSLTDTNANISLQQIGSSSSFATLFMTNLDNFNATISKIAIGDFFFGIGTTAGEGSLHLAKTNFITTSWVGNYGAASPTVNITNAIQLGVGSSGTLANNFLFLGLSNSIFTDSIGVAGLKSGNTCTFAFNPVFTNSNPTALLRGMTGGSSRITQLVVGDNAGTGATSAGSQGLVDFTSGTVDAKVDTMILGRDRNAGTAATGDIGTLRLTGGIIDVNNLILGDQAGGTTASAVTGTFNIRGLTTTPVLVVNRTLSLGITALAGSTGTFGKLNVTNGTVLVSNIVAGTVSSANAITLTNATLIVSNAMTTAGPGLSAFSMGNSVVGFTLAGNSIKGVVTNLTTSGSTNLIQIDSTIPVIFASYPTNVQLIKYTTWSGPNNFGLTNIPVWAPNATLVSNSSGSSIDLSLPSDPRPVILSGPIDYANGPGFTESGNFSVGISPASVGPLTYQWFYFPNGGPTNAVTDVTDGGGAVFTGSTSNSLVIANARVANSGNYFVVVSNAYGSATSRAAVMTVSASPIPPVITGPNNPTVIQGNNATFTAGVSGFPLPTLQWFDNSGNPIAGVTGNSLVVSNVQFSQNGFNYCLVASNTASVVTNCGTLTVIVPPVITLQPTNLVVTNTAAVSFLAAATGVPNPTFQWFKNNNPITAGVNASAVTSNLVIASASPADSANYFVRVSNSAGVTNSTTVSLTVNSTMIATSMSPSNGATGICYDTPLSITFSAPPVLNSAFKIRIFNVTNSTTPVDTIDLSLNGTLNVQPHSPFTGDNQAFAYFPVIITGSTAAIYPHGGVMTSNQTYYVVVDDGAFKDAAGAFFAGVAPNAWQFTTKPTGPVNATNLVVDIGGNGDFVTVQGALDSIPANNTNYTLINIRNGTYTEIVDTGNKNHVTFRGQSRTGTIVGYANNNNINGTTHARMAFKINSQNVAVENMTIVNTTPQGGSQAEAIMIETSAGHFIFNNAEVDSRQDTLLANVNSSQGYFYNSLIQGNFDYIWGGGNLFFTNCEIRTIGGTTTPNLSAPRTDNGSAPTNTTGSWAGHSGLSVSNGFSFVNCRISGFNTTITNCTMASGNGSLNGLASWAYCSFDTGVYTNATPANAANYVLWEFGNTNLSGVLLDNTVSPFVGFTNLVLGEPRLVAATNASIWLYGWVPQLAPNIITQPANVTIGGGQPTNLTVTATGVPDPTYQWFHRATLVQSGSSPIYNITSAQASDAGAYSVVVSTPAGSATSVVASVTVTVPPVGEVTTLQTLQNTPASIAVAKLVSEAFGNAPINVTAVSATSTNGGVVVLGGGSVTYTPVNNFVGADQFTYTLTDALSAATIVTVNVTVTSTNAASLNQVGTLQMVGGNPQVTFAGIPGRTYSIQRTASLVTPNWTKIGTMQADTHGNIIFTDTNPLAGQAFYRTVFP